MDQAQMGEQDWATRLQHWPGYSPGAPLFLYLVPEEFRTKLGLQVYGVASNQPMFLSEAKQLWEEQLKKRMGLGL